MLPIAQYPPIAPPTVQVSCSYPGASAQVVADTVAAPIEQQVNGVEGMLYMSSQCGNDGSYNLTVTFDLNSDLNTSLVMVQNRVALATPQLPDCVQKQGLTIKKKSPNILLVVSFFSKSGKYDDLYLSNYATIHVKDELFRLPGVGDITYLGQRDYSIRAWLDPQKLASREHHRQRGRHRRSAAERRRGPGQVGQPPSPAGQGFQLPIDTLGRLEAARAVRRHHRQGDSHRLRGRAGPASSASATWPGRDGGRQLQHLQLRRRHALGGAGRLSASGHQRAGRGQERPRQDGRTGKAIPRGARLRHLLRHHALHPRIGGGRGQDPVDRRRAGGGRGAGVSCKTGGRP